MAKFFKEIKKNKVVFSLLILIFILILGNNLREYQYASVPMPGETADEYSFGWLGISLIKDKYPVAWSGIGAYKTHDHQRINVDNLFDKDPERPLFPINKPWFDHPPLFGLLTGGYAYLKGIKTFEDASVIVLRRPMLKIALVTTVLIFILATRFFGFKAGIIAGLLYSVIPTTVISSRLALAENAIIPLFLGAVICADYYLKRKKIIYWYKASILAAMAMLCKLSGISVFITLFFIALKFGKRKTAKLIGVSALFLLAAVLVFGVYGALFDWETFVRVATFNSQRFFGAGAEIFFQAIIRTKITTGSYFTDGWIPLGWISIFIVSFVKWNKSRPSTILTMAVFSQLIVFLLFGSEPYGWYCFPFYPFLIIATAYLFVMLFEKPNLFLAVSLFLLPFGTALHRLIGVEGFQPYVPHFRMFTVFALLLFTFSLKEHKNTIYFKRLFLLAMFAFGVWLSVLKVYYYCIENWYFVT